MNSLRYGSPRTEDILNSLAQDRLHHTLSLPSSAIAIALPSFQILNKRRRRNSSAQSERPSITGRSEGCDVAVDNLPDDALPSHGRAAAEGSNAMMDGNGAESLSLSLWLLLFIDGPTSQNWKKT